MKQFLTCATFALLVGGVIFYGWAKIILLTILIGSGLFFGSAAVWGIYEAILKRTAAAVPSTESRATKDQAVALASIPVVHDDDISRLRRMAGLE